jgi:hypothetical protein
MWAQSGPDYFVEVDIVMDGATPLWQAHDISQQLQDKIEVLPNVERAFVHVDHETTHRPVRLPPLRRCAQGGLTISIGAPQEFVSRRDMIIKYYVSTDHVMESTLESCKCRGLLEQWKPL